MSDFVTWCVKNGHADMVKKDLWRRRRMNEARSGQPKKEPENQTNDRREYYRTIYLKTDHWKNLKAQKLAANPRCEECSSTGILDAHHKRYRSLYDVRITDLLTLCRSCHHKLHQGQIVLSTWRLGGKMRRRMARMHLQHHRGISL